MAYSSLGERGKFPDTITNGKFDRECLAVSMWEMPTGPKGQKGQKRPTDVASNAVRVMQIATGQINEPAQPASGKNEAAAALGRLGGKARAVNLSKKKRADIAKKAAKARWSK